MWSKDFNRVAFIKEREVAVNLVCKLSRQVWHAFVSEYCQVVVRGRCQSYHLWEMYSSLSTLSYHIQFQAIVVHILSGAIPFWGYLRVGSFPSRFFPLQVTTGKESSMDMKEFQSLGLDCIMVSTSALVNFQF